MSQVQNSPTFATVLNTNWIHICPSENTDPESLPSSHSSHHELSGHGVLLSNGAGIVPKHSTPPLVPPGILSQVHNLINLIFALRVVLARYEIGVKYKVKGLQCAYATPRLHSGCIF